MKKEECIVALRHWTRDCDVDLVTTEDRFELRPSEAVGKRRIFIRFESDEDSGVPAIHYAVLVGCITDSRSLPQILARNRNGVMGTEFYFSAEAEGSQINLYLETKHFDAELTAEKIEEILSSWWFDPLFTMTWNFPNGVENFLW